MSADTAHQLILEMLLGLRATGLVKDVWLLSRLKSDFWLGPLDQNETLFFIPDLHIISETEEARFEYSFNKLSPNQTIQRKQLLEELVTQLIAIKAELADNQQALRTYQLGDLFDFWRQGDFDLLRRTTVKDTVKPILLEYSELIRKLSTRIGGLNAQFVNGNHDPFLGELDEPNVKRGWFAFNQQTFRPHVMVTHGDLFDPFERTVPEELKKQAVRAFGTGVAGKIYAVPTKAETLLGSEAPKVVSSADAHLDPVVNINSAQVRVDAGGNLTDESALELKSCHELLPDAARTVLALRHGNQKTMTDFELPANQAEIRLLAVGHSHHPRVVAVTDAQHKPLFTLLDVGAWLEKIDLAGLSLPGPREMGSCQLGVVCGDDARVYQLEPGPAALA